VSQPIGFSVEWGLQWTNQNESNLKTLLIFMFIIGALSLVEHVYGWTGMTFPLWVYFISCKEHIKCTDTSEPCDTLLQSYTQRHEGISAASELQDTYKQIEGTVSRGGHQEEDRTGL
jgi:hypothetical protein